MCRSSALKGVAGVREACCDAECYAVTLASVGHWCWQNGNIAWRFGGARRKRQKFGSGDPCGIIIASDNLFIVVVHTIQYLVLYSVDQIWADLRSGAACDDRTGEKSDSRILDIQERLDRSNSNRNTSIQ